MEAPSSLNLTPLVLHRTEMRRPRHQVFAAARVMHDGFLDLTFQVENSKHVVWPPPGGATREDGLWRSTCFECFIGSQSESYTEWNFAPNGNWAAYNFTNYRAGMKNSDVASPHIRSSVLGDAKNFSIRILPAESSKASAVRLSVTAVVLEAGESGPFYWALNHAGEKPDFHLNDSFSLKMEF